MPEQFPSTVPATEFPAAAPGDSLATAWETYRAAVSQLLAADLEGKFVLIKGSHILGTYDSWAEARQAGLRQFLTEPFLVQQVRCNEPVLRIRVFSLPCRA